MTELELELVAPTDPRVETIWRELEGQGASSYFLAWGWVENWLAMLPPENAPTLAVVRDAGVPVAAAWFGCRRVTRHHLVRSRSRFLHATGIARFDEICAEQVGAVGPGGLPMVLANLPDDWDEVVLPAIDRAILDGLSDRRVHIDRDVAAPFVSLSRVRAAPGGYVSLLGASTRSHLRRARREAGELDVEIARDAHHAADIYAELVRLHTARWHARGEAGAFADPWFDAFHQRLIAQRFHVGELELVRVRARGRTIGCLYNFVYRDRVAFYQSGLAEIESPHDKPGLLCHAAAIEHAARAGLAIYDFLAGDGRYKHELATDESRLVWARIQRPLLRFAIEEQLRGWKQRLAAT